MTTTARDALASTREELASARRTLAAHETAADRGERVDPRAVADVRELVTLTERRVAALEDQAAGEQLADDRAAWSLERGRRLDTVSAATDAVNAETAAVRDAVHRLVLATTALAGAQDQVHALGQEPGAHGALVANGVVVPQITPRIPAPSPAALLDAALADALAGTALGNSHTATDARANAAAL